MEYFCTLFDHNYLHKGLTLYESLNATMKKEFHLYILCMSDICYKKLNKFKLPQVTLISLCEFENEELLIAKSNRSIEEYCWTCTPAIIKFVLDNYKVGRCTYLDADIFFFDSPIELLEEMKSNAVMITRHRYTEELQHMELESGTYNVQFMPFCNNEKGKKVLQWWYESCLEWCYRTYQDGKMGDQMYLNCWMTKFTSVCELNHIGGGIAPWNAARYTAFIEKNKICVKEIEASKIMPAIFYHFHTLKMFDKDVIKLASGVYKLPGTIISNLYKPYIKALMNTIKYYGIAEDLVMWKVYEKFQSESIDYLNVRNNYYNLSLFYSENEVIK